MDTIIKMIDNLINRKEYKIIQEDIIVIYYEIGKYITINNINMYSVEDILRKKYGLLIGFTKRNIKNMIKFYNLYKNYDINILKKISWDNHLIIMKYKNKDELIDYCLNYNIDKNNLKKIIKNGFNKKYINNSYLENDTVTLEIIKFIGSKNT